MMPGQVYPPMPTTANQRIQTPFRRSSNAVGQIDPQAAQQAPQIKAQPGPVRTLDLRYQQ